MPGFQNQTQQGVSAGGERNDEGRGEGRTPGPGKGQVLFFGLGSNPTAATRMWGVVGGGLSLALRLQRTLFTAGKSRGLLISLDRALRTSDSFARLTATPRFPVARVPTPYSWATALPRPTVQWAAQYSLGSVQSPDNTTIQYMKCIFKLFLISFTFV